MSQIYCIVFYHFHCYDTAVCVCSADLFEDEEIQGLLKFRPWWSDLCPDSIRQGEAGELESYLSIPSLPHMKG